MLAACTARAVQVIFLVTLIPQLSTHHSPHNQGADRGGPRHLENKCVFLQVAITFCGSFS